MASLTSEEIELLEKFRDKVRDQLSNDYEQSDLFLIRWIRAREWNLEVAESMLRNSIKWRKEQNIPQLLASSPDPYYTKNFPYWLNGVDLHGRPVLCIPMGDWDVRKAVDDGRIEGFNEYFNRIFERVGEAIQNCNSRRGPDETRVSQFVCIVDWDKFSIRQTSNIKAVQSLLAVVSVYEAHYPEILGQALFINTNPVFQILFALMKPMMAPRTLSKVICYGSNRTEWEAEVRVVVDETQVPRQFGG